ncbi:hypothetical protein Tco_0568565 [Tanacetum coccineum]
MDEVCSVCCFGDGDSFAYDPNLNSFNDSPNISDYPPQPQYQTYYYKLCGNDAHYGYDCPPQPPIVYDDDDEESSIPLRDIISELPLSVAITPDLPITDSLIMEDKHLNTILETESDEVIKFSVENLVLIPSESEDTSESNSDCDLPSCDDFSPINVSKEKFVTFSNPLFDSNNDFTSSDDESLSDEDVPEDNVKIYSNPLFKFDDEYISSDVNPIFDEVLENIESKDSYVSNLDKPAFLVTRLSDFNEDECFIPGGDVDEIEFLLHHDPSTPKLSITSILEGFTDEPPLKENDDLFDLESKENEWKKILYDAPIDDLMTEDKVFDPDIHEKKISPTYVSLPFKDRHYLSFTYVIRIFLPYFTYPVNSSLPLSSESEDIIFDPGISTFHFSSLELVAYEYSMEVCSSTCSPLPFSCFVFCVKDCPDYEDSRARENIETKDSYVSNLDEPTLLVTRLSDFNKDECFNPGGDVDEIEFLLHHDQSTPKLSVASILEGFTDEPPLEENDDLFDLESK